MTLTAAYEIDAIRLAEVTSLAGGSHEPGDGEMCAMEAVAFIAREPWSDRPKCASKVIGAFMRAWNDGLPNEERTALLLPFVPRLVGTAATAKIEERRSLMAADWLIRTHAPAWLRLTGLTAQAGVLASLPEIMSMAQISSIRALLEEVRRDAAAAGAGGGADVSTAWGAAGGEAAWAAVVATAEAAVEAAVVASVRNAWAAVVAAVVAAAGAAAGAKLAPTTVELQRSAVALIERMLAA